MTETEKDPIDSLWEEQSITPDDVGQIGVDQGRFIDTIQFGLAIQKNEEGFPALSDDQQALVSKKNE